MTSSTGTRRRFLRTAAAVAPLSALGVLAPPVSARPRYRGEDWPADLKDAVERAMPTAVDWARQARWPYGAVLVDIGSGAVVAGARNTTDLSGDFTAHAEVNLLREAAEARLDLPSHVVVTTAEPCAMCAGALLWGKVWGVAYGTSVAKLISYGVPQIDLSFTDIARRSHVAERPAVAGDVRADLTDPLYRRRMK
ncbi:deaminase [Streptomyces sp. NPDC051162]|uniref:nucleoside deaminase n=1 Tax=unclassified Streptomyces TaxID=2593676 RepID=UPI003448EEEA